MRWIDAHGAARRDQCGGEGGQRQCKGDAEIRQRIRGADAEQLRFQNRTEQQRDDGAGHDARAGELERMTDNKAQHL